jgi:hypothetical protein
LRAGEPITVAAIGGSVSFGHGLYDAGFKQEKEGPGNLHWRIFNWINAQFPHKDHKFVNGAVPGGSELTVNMQYERSADAMTLDFPFAI